MSRGAALSRAALLARLMRAAEAGDHVPAALARAAVRAHPVVPGKCARCRRDAHGDGPCPRLAAALAKRERRKVARATPVWRAHFALQRGSKP